MIGIKTLIYFAVILLASCASNEQDDHNLTGTWRVESVNTIYDVSTDVLQSTYTSYSTIYIIESDTDIQLSECHSYSNPSEPPFGMLRNGDSLSFVNDIDIPYQIINTQRLSRSFEITSSTDRTVYNQTLTRSSSTIDLDRGFFQLNGPILTANNQTHVCLVQDIGSNQDGFRYVIQIPFDNLYIELLMRLTQPLMTGSYQYDINEAGNSPVLYTFDVTSNSDAFWNTISSNTLAPNQADLNITTSNENFIEGNFSFTGQDGNDYTGSFNFIPY